MTTTAPRPDVEAVIREMVRRIVEGFQPERIILFGSHARGDAGPDSDVDLLVVMPVQGKKVDTAIQIRTVLHGMGVPKDVFVTTPEEFEVHKQIVGTLPRAAAREGRVLYERRG